MVPEKGAPSAVRESLAVAGECERSLNMLPDGYKELLFPAAEDGGFAMEQRALHIWARGEHFLMGLPNTDGSFTGTGKASIVINEHNPMLQPQADGVTSSQGYRHFPEGPTPPQEEGWPAIARVPCPAS